MELGTKCNSIQAAQLHPVIGLGDGKRHTVTRHFTLVGQVQAYTEVGAVGSSGIMAHDQAGISVITNRDRSGNRPGGGSAGVGSGRPQAPLPRRPFQEARPDVKGVYREVMPQFHFTRCGSQDLTAHAWFS